MKTKHLLIFGLLFLAVLFISGCQKAEQQSEAAVEDFQLRLLKRALKKAQFSQKRASKILGLTYHQFRGLYRKFSKDLLAELLHCLGSAHGLALLLVFDVLKANERQRRRSQLRRQ